MKTILMTGAAGRIGTFLRPELAGKYRLRLSDIKPIRDLRRGETFVRADISKLSDMLRVTKGVDAVVHFGGQSGEHDWDHILSANIIGFYNALEAARRNGVKRFLVATSNHAVGFYRCDIVVPAGIIGGVLWQRSPDLPLVTACVVSGIGLVVFLVIGSRQRRANADPPPGAAAHS